MRVRYLVLGSGRQGVAAAYDLAKFGDAEEVVLADIDLRAASVGAERANDLVGRTVARAVRADASDSDHLAPLLEGIASVVSGVHYPFNPGLTDAAIDARVNLCDMGGNTDVVLKQIERDEKARRAGVTVVPDCGMGPGMNVSLAVHAMSLLDVPREVRIYVGGLPQNPKPPWNYALTFNIEGLTNEYTGHAHALRDGKLVTVPCLSEIESLSFPQPIGTLEAAVTSGGLSTAPFTFEGTLDVLEYKTLRYPGHFAKLKAFADLGLFDLDPVRVGETEIIPREVMHALLEPRISETEVRDIGIIRVECIGEKDGQGAQSTVELVDEYDEETGFTAMQRLTGWHTSIVAILAARGALDRGVIPVERAVPGQVMVEEARKRGFVVQERIVPDLS
jgi:lysine 6-dehydrogenase